MFLEISQIVIVWHSDGPDNSNYGVCGQRYDSTGAKLGAEFQVNTYTSGNQWTPNIGTFSGGKFIITWQSVGQDHSSYGVYGQVFDSTGAKVGSEFQVSTYTFNFQGNSDVRTFSDGKFIVAWQSWRQDGFDYGVFGQRFQVIRYNTGC